MSIIGVFAIFSDDFKGNVKITGIVLFVICILLFIFIFSLWYPYYLTYREIKKVKTCECYCAKIKVLKVKFIYYRAKHYCGASSVKIICNIDNNKKVLYYIFEEDTIFYKDIKKMISGYLDVRIYNNSNIIKSLESKLDKKVNF